MPELAATSANLSEELSAHKFQQHVYKFLIRSTRLKMESTVHHKTLLNPAETLLFSVQMASLPISCVVVDDADIGALSGQKVQIFFPQL